MSESVAPDGSPVDVYLALPPGDTPKIIDGELEPHSSVLELGSGPGRITHPLLKLGHDVVAVDDSPEMLQHIRGAEKVLADLFTLDLGRTFDAVVAGSHLINSPSRNRRLGLLEVCRRHVRVDGVVLIQRYEPGWASSPRPSRTSSGDVHISFEPASVGDGSFRGRVTYELNGRTWMQEFDGANIGEAQLEVEAGRSGLRFRGWLDHLETWARLVPVHGVHGAEDE